MRILLIHADYLEFEAKQPTPMAEEVPPELKSGRVDEALVAFIAVEEDDGADPDAVVENAAKEIESVFRKVEAERIVLYPYAHLSPSLSSPTVAIPVLNAVRDELQARGLEVVRLPFGWYKAFTLSCKGHPLSELSRQITVGKVEEAVSEALKQEEKVESSWYILEPNGSLHEIKLKDGEIEGYDFSGNENLKKFALHEIAKHREVKEEPPHVKLMRRLELVDYEPGSDPGNFRFYPNGRLIKNLLELWVSKRTMNYGAMEVESPIMYDYEHPALKDYLERFPARQYVVESAKKKLFLRFSACFGQFLMMSSSVISYRNLPLKIYELTRYSFRLEKAGELSGLRRLRTFTMPDMHTLCKDEVQAKEEFMSQFKLGMECLKDLEFNANDYETGIRFTREFWEKNKDFVTLLVKLVKRPVLLEVWSFRYAYFDPKFEFNFVDNSDKASALSTVQIDHENASRYGIVYIDEHNEKKHPLILHCSPSGSLERVMYALLEKAYKDQTAGKSPSLPLWLSPTQVRLVPVGEQHLKYCQKLADGLEKNQIRADVDDRNETVAKRVRNAEREWVPYVIVVGDKEMKTKKLPARVRGLEKLKPFSAKGLTADIRKKTEDMPFRPLALPKLLSMRPIFVGS
jgi:threonyl-tRNA synthetase